MAGYAKHYDEIGENYAKTEFSRPGAYRDWQLGLVRAALSVNITSIADVGGGDGIFTRDCFAPGVFLEVVEPNEAMMTVSKLENTVFTCRDGGAWAASSDGRTYDAVLVKEAVHHITDRVSFWKDVRAHRLAVEGAVVIITRPKVNIDYPFWDACRAVWAENQPAEEELAKELVAAGFSDVTITVETYPMKIPLERWLALIKSRFWSTFSAFSDTELDAAISEIRKREQRPDGFVEFEERIVVIVGRKA